LAAVVLVHGLYHHPPSSRCSPTEAAQFLATLQQVQSALPQYRQDLVEIAALAWPLMPVHLQPRALAATITVTALPVPHTQGAGYWPLRSLTRAA
jgi:hypothetical protein